METNYLFNRPEESEDNEPEIYSSEITNKSCLTLVVGSENSGVEEGEIQFIDQKDVSEVKQNEIVDAVDEDLFDALLADLFLTDLDLRFCFVSVVGLRLEDPIRNGFFDDPSLDRVSLETLPCFLVRFLNIVFGFVVGGLTLR